MNIHTRCQLIVKEKIHGTVSLIIPMFISVCTDKYVIDVVYLAIGVTNTNMKHYEYFFLNCAILSSVFCRLMYSQNGNLV